jgi:coenzyme F420-0:L-glutamate ligase/coenzyme F420-1:gamma-L-glutamate ligase
MSVPALQIFPLPGLPEIAKGDDLAALITDAVGAAGLRPMDEDIFVVAQKIVSKAEGQVVDLAGITPSEKAKAWAEEWGKDARVVELILTESESILRMERGIIIAETRHGFVCANAGIDVSNTDAGTAVLLPHNPDVSARNLQARLAESFGVHVAVIVSDTFGRAWREGLVNVALGVAGMNPLRDHRGEKDANGNPISATVIAAADEIASAAELVMRKSENIPVAIVRGVECDHEHRTGSLLVRPKAHDLFR